MKLGYDIEYAVRQNNSFVPAGVLPIKGTKGRPEPLQFGGLEIDCCAVEITPPPAEDEDSFTANILNLLDEVKQRFRATSEFVAIPSINFTEEQLVNTRSAMEMGCSPDYNAWTGATNQRPSPYTTLRTFGGHIHIEGGTVNTIKSCDLILGMWSVINDADNNRRKLYGKAGSFRPKPYGVEYRVLSNFWCDDEGKIREVYKLTRYAQEQQDNLESVIAQIGTPEYIQAVINDSLADDAKRILKIMGI